MRDHYLDKTYASIEYADEHFEFELDADFWHETCYHEKAKALVTATRQIDSLNFIGVKADPNQILQFPRRLGNHIMPLNDHEQLKLSLKIKQAPIGSLIPDDIKKATCEQALYLLKQKDSKRDDLVTDLKNQGVISYHVGDTGFTLSQSSITASTTLSSMSHKTRVYLDKFIKRYTRLV